MSSDITGHPANSLVQDLNTWGGERVVYTDHDGDPIALVADMYYFSEEDTKIPVFLITSMQGTKSTTIRVPQDVLLDMMDRAGFNLPEGIKAKSS